MTQTAVRASPAAVFCIFFGNFADRTEHYAVKYVLFNRTTDINPKGD